MTRMFPLYDASMTKRSGPHGEEQGEAAAASRLGFDVQAAPVPVDDVLHDGEAEAGPAELPGAGRIDPVEPLGQPRDMLLGDAFALVGDAEGDHGLGRADPLQPLAAGDRVFDPLKGDAHLAAL